METTRRNLIKSFAGLAAFAVAPGTTKFLGESDREKLIRMMKTGVVQGQYFLFTAPGPVILDAMEGPLTIINCHFRWEGPFDETCFFQIRGQNAVRIIGGSITSPKPLLFSNGVFDAFPA